MILASYFLVGARAMRRGRVGLTVGGIAVCLVGCGSPSSQTTLHDAAMAVLNAQNATFVSSNSSGPSSGGNTTTDVVERPDRLSSRLVLLDPHGTLTPFVKAGSGPSPYGGVTSGNQVLATVHIGSVAYYRNQETGHWTQQSIPNIGVKSVESAFALVGVLAKATNVTQDGTTYVIGYNEAWKLLESTPWSPARPFHPSHMKLSATVQDGMIRSVTLRVFGRKSNAGEGNFTDSEIITRVGTSPGVTVPA
jgi:hypothetical protein